MKNYILIPSDFRNSDECLDLLMCEGAAGYGVFIMCCEFLRECENYQMRDDPKRLSFALRVNDVDLVTRVLKNYGLFATTSEGMIESPMFTKSMSGYEKKRKQCSEAARARHAASEQSANTSAKKLQTQNAESANAVQTLYVNAPNSIVSNSRENGLQPNQTVQTQSAAAELVNFGGVWTVEREFIDSLCKEKSNGPSSKYLAELQGCEVEGHNAAAIAEVARFFKLNDRQAFALMKITDNAKCGSDNMIDVIACWQHARKTKFEARYPLSYILSKIRSYDK